MISNIHPKYSYIPLDNNHLYAYSHICRSNDKIIAKAALQGKVNSKIKTVEGSFCSKLFLNYKYPLIGKVEGKVFRNKTCSLHSH